MSDTDKNQVLLVDEDLEISRSVGSCLTRSNCSVVTCGDGTEAITLLKKKDFNVLITDIQIRRFCETATGGV
jgi:CheY-like chemotaxis protein